MGDFNQNDINWELLQASSVCGQIFVDTILESFLTQHVMEGTPEANILDLVLSSEPEMVENLEVTCPISNSDHKVIYWDLICETCTSSSEQKLFNYHKGNYKEIVSYLSNIN